jgi:hypothetical protein
MWTNQLFAVIGADNAALVHRSRGLRKQILDQKHVTFLRQAEIAEAETLVWMQATTQLDKLLGTMQFKANTQLNITVASDFVRYLTLPPQQVHMSADEKLAYAAAAYREVYGAVADSWQIKLQDSPAHEVATSAAIDSKLLERLKQIALNRELKLASVQPYLMSAFNGLHSQLKHANGFLAIVETNRLLLISLQDGKCQNLRVSVRANDWQTGLVGLMTRESLLNESSDKTLTIYAPAQKNTALSSMTGTAMTGWQVKQIGNLKSALNSVQYSMLEAAL